jgi:hypothetical protein
MSNARKLILAGVSAVIIVIALISLLHPARLVRFLPTHVNLAKSGSLTPSSNTPTTLPGGSADRDTGTVKRKLSARDALRRKNRTCIMTILKNVISNTNDRPCRRIEPVAQGRIYGVKSI